MSQHDLTIDNDTRPAVRADITSALQALGSNSSGTTAPASPIAQQFWVDTDTPSSTIWTLNIYDGADWIPLAYIDSTTNTLLPFIGGGTATVASASTVDLGAAPQSTITISGTTTVTGFGSTMKPGQSKVVIASGAWQLTYNASSMKINGLASYTMAAGDKALVTCASAGNYDVTVFPKSGLPVASGGVSTTGSPANGNLARFSGANTVTNTNLTGDVTTSGGVATTLATVNSDVGSFTNANVTVNAKGQVTAASSGTSGVPTALGVGSIILAVVSGVLAADATVSAASLTQIAINGSSTGLTSGLDSLSGTWKALQSTNNGSRLGGLFQRTV